MIIYNITMKPEWPIVEKWLQWMQDIYIPEVLGTGCFKKHQLVRLLQIDETDGPSYALQLYANTLDKYDYYLRHYAAAFRLQMNEKWGDNYIDFHTLMQIVE